MFKTPGLSIHICHFTHNLAGAGSITLPLSRSISRACRDAKLTFWNYKVAESANWNHKAAKSATFVKGRRA